MTILTYKGYQASVDYEDGHLVIQLLHIDDFISTICHDAGEVEREFHKLVDEYLETCRQLGREPKKPYKGSLNIRMPPELHRLTAMAASSAKISLNAWIVTACQEKLASTEKVETEHQVPALTTVNAGFDTQIQNLGVTLMGPVIQFSTNFRTGPITFIQSNVLTEPLTSPYDPHEPGEETFFNPNVERIGPGTGGARVLIGFTGAAPPRHRWLESAFANWPKRETT
jgi:predicted HicB family RNase H-like nuclease